MKQLLIIAALILAIAITASAQFEPTITPCDAKAASITGLPNATWIVDPAGGRVYGHMAYTNSQFVEVLFYGGPGNIYMTATNQFSINSPVLYWNALPVTLGANDSGGPGFRALVVPNGP